jgi:hypothetical protein
MYKHYQKVVKFFYYNKHGKIVEYFIWDRDARDFMITLLESSHKYDIGAVYMMDQEGNVKELDYYND